MKKTAKIISCIAVLALIALSFLTGNYVKEQENLNGRQRRCHALIVFAVEKAENEVISEPGVMQALVSNVYAAYQFCDDPALAAQMHDLWNALVFEGDSYIGREESLANRLKDLAARVQLAE